VAFAVHPAGKAERPKTGAVDRNQFYPVKRAAQNKSADALPSADRRHFVCHRLLHAGLIFTRIDKQLFVLP
jgi:hypothetical protein